MGGEVREGRSKRFEDLAKFLALRAVVGELGSEVRFDDWEVVEEVVEEGVIQPNILVHLGSSGAEAAELHRQVQQSESPKAPGMREAMTEEAFGSEGLEAPEAPWKYISHHEREEEY